jgi:serine/threonine protein kinase
MGQCNTKHVASRSLDGRSKVALDMFLFQSVLGEGGFGKVMCGNFIHTDQWHAVKAIQKKKLLNLRTGMKMLYNELESLRKIPPHPFVCGIHYAFHDK